MTKQEIIDAIREIVEHWNNNITDNLDDQDYTYAACVGQLEKLLYKAEEKEQS